MILILIISSDRSSNIDSVRRGVILGQIQYTDTKRRVWTLLGFCNRGGLELNQVGAGRAVPWIARCGRHLIQSFKAISGNIHPVLVNFLLIVYRVSGVIVWLEIV